MHRYPIIRRWADLDSLNHVNNVRYGEWAKEGLLAAQHEGVVPLGAVWPSAVQIAFHRPVLLRPGRIWVETTVTEDGFAQRITEGDGGARVVYAAIDTTIGRAPGPLAKGPDTEQPYPVHPRRVEAGPDGRIDYPRMFEYFQEARIFAVWKAMQGLAVGSQVVGRVEARFGSPLLWRAEPYLAHSWIDRAGRTSAVLVTQIRDGQAVLAEATSTLVAFDVESQRLRRWTDEERDGYARLTLPRDESAMPSRESAVPSDESAMPGGQP